MINNKFKVGDRIVNAKWAKRDNDDFKWTGLVAKVTKGWYIIKADDGEDWEEYNESELVLESVYNSPLFKIMNEVDDELT